MYSASAQGIDEHMINVHYYYYHACRCNVSLACFTSHDLNWW